MKKVNVTVSKKVKEKLNKRQRDFDELIRNLTTEFNMGCLDATLETITKGCLDVEGVNDYLRDDISYAKEDCE